MATLTWSAALPIPDEAMSLVIHGPDDAKPATRGKTTTTPAKGKNIAPSRYIFKKSGEWRIGAILDHHLATLGGKQHALSLAALKREDAGAILNWVAVDDVLQAARNAGSLEFKMSKPDAAVFLVRLASVLESGFQERMANMPKEAFEQSVAALLRNIAPPMSAPEVQMAQRVAMARAAILEEFGYQTKEQLARGSRAKDPAGMVHTWRARGKVFSVPLPQSTARDADVYPAFQFDDGKPLPVVAEILGAFNKSRDGWALAHWFTSGTGLLPNSARPVDLLKTAPEAVEAAARFDAMPAAA
jgi:hypothetical protein